MLASGVELRIRSLREQIAEALERDIVTGQYRPGERLVERELVDRFGVSSIPVREALQDLESRGLVRKRHNRGCTVVELTPEDIQAICRLRAVLEPRVVEWAAARMTPEWVEQLSAQMNRMAEAAASSQVPQFFHEDLLLHKLIWEASGNKYAAQALEAGLGALFASGLVGGMARGALNLQDEVRKHRRLVHLICAGEGPKAAEVLLQIAGHFENSFRGPAAAAS